MLILAGWVDRGHQDTVDSPLEESRVLREPLGGKRLLSTESEHRRLAAKAKASVREGLFESSTLVTPGTLLRGSRRLIAKKYAGSKSCTVARPRTTAEIEELILQMRPRRARLAHREFCSLLVRQDRTLGHTPVREGRSAIGATRSGEVQSNEFFLIVSWIPLRGRTMPAPRAIRCEVEHYCRRAS